uniref:Uncharacterized protein n=1 Tax=Rhizophora mucronata TaxID=61149 RepID=A0A2P2NC41_RHIMU
MMQYSKKNNWIPMQEIQTLLQIQHSQLKIK